MISVSLLLSLLGCSGGGSHSGDSVSDSDTSVDDGVYEDVTFQVTVTPPFAEATATVSTNETDRSFELVSCDSISRACVYELTVLDDWAHHDAKDFDLDISAPNYAFVQHGITVTKDGPEAPEITWYLGGCADDTWDPVTAGFECPSWTPGEYGLAPSGMYYAEDDGHEWEVTTTVEDIDGDGKEEIVLEGVSQADTVQYTLSGDVFSGNGDGCTGGGTIEDDLKTIYSTRTRDDNQEFVKTLIK